MRNKNHSLVCLFISTNNVVKNLSTVLRKSRCSFINNQNIRLFHNNFGNFNQFSSLKIKISSKHRTANIFCSNLCHYIICFLIHFCFIQKTKLCTKTICFSKENVFSNSNSGNCSTFLNYHAHTLVKCIYHRKRLPLFAFELHFSRFWLLHTCNYRSYC